jgi:nicotinate-nucleotide pyrophosphorylase (carboxylating)
MIIAGTYARRSMPVDTTLLTDLVARALDEDVGTGDLTSHATVPEGTRAIATITQKAPGVVFGLDVAEEAFRQCDPGAEVQRLAQEGVWQEPGTPVLRITATAAGILAAERTALNFLQRLSGVATLTAQYVEAIEGTGARILDTRKTTPTLRALEKAAVIAGGGTSHRFGLFDEILIKENHAEMAGGVGAAVRAAQERFPGVPLEVECRDAGEVAEALEAGAPRILLDNMTPEQLRDVVAQVGGRAVLEASGGVTLQTVRKAADTGVHFVSVGALTHSAPSLDLSLLLEASP